MSQYRELYIGPRAGHLPDQAVVAAEVVDDHVVVAFGDHRVALQVDWLRDNCPCDRCHITQTDERRWQPWRGGATGVTAVQLAGGELSVSFTDGHTASWSPADWRRIDRTSHRGSYTSRLWRAGYHVDRFDHDATVHDPVARREMFAAFRRDGVVVVTGSPTVPGTVLTYLRSIGLTLRDSSLGLIFDVRLDPAGYNIAFTSEEVPPHNDNAQYTHPPSGQVLAMLVNDATGGESIVVDGFQVVDQLTAADPAAVDVLASLEVGFRQYSTDVDAHTRAPLVRRDRHGRCTHLRFSNQLRQPLPFDDPQLADWYRAYRLLGAMVSDPSNQVSFRLQAGEMLVVNNHRVLHARAAYQPDGARHLQDVYFDADDVFGHLDRMQGVALDEMATTQAAPSSVGAGA